MVNLIAWIPVQPPLCDTEKEKKKAAHFITRARPLAARVIILHRVLNISNNFNIKTILSDIATFMRTREHFPSLMDVRPHLYMVDLILCIFGLVVCAVIVSTTACGYKIDEKATRQFNTKF